MSLIEVFDDVLPDARAYRDELVTLPYQSVPLGPITFHGIAIPPRDAWAEWLRAHGFTPWLSFVRRSPAGQVEPHFVHSDADMGQRTALLYLNPDPPTEDGTSFWKRVETGDVAGDVVAADDGHDLSRWARWHHVAAAFNRCVIFASELFHSRALLENYGTGESSRLVQVAFERRM